MRLSPGFHIFCRLSRKVSSYCSFYCVVHEFFRVLLATIRDQGLCLCAQCLAPKSKLDQLGLATDTRNRVNKARKYQADTVIQARNAIYLYGMPIGGVAVERLLKATSTVPTSVRTSLLSERI